jgi:hypothetical protein
MHPFVFLTHRRLDNGSLHFLPLAYENSRHPGYEETRVRCRASNPYGIIVSKIISVKPGQFVLI